MYQMNVPGLLKLGAAALSTYGAALSVPAAKPAMAKLTVVATTPDLGSIAREIGGNAVDVKVLAKPSEDPHFVDAKPSHVVTLNRADALIEGGADLDIGWLPPLLESARNDKIASGAPGLVIASSGIRMLEVPTSLDRARGDVHAAGNPHFLIDPATAKIVAGEIADHLSQIDPKDAAAFKANLAKFSAAVDAKTAEWAKTMAPYRGAKIVTYHNDFPYFSARYGLQLIGTLEPKPGIAPSAAHLAEVIGAMKTQGGHVILVQPYQSRKTAETVARQTDATVVDVSQQPGAMKNTDTYLAMMDNLVNSIAAALGKK
jgi:zinc/manganese transport system substrate-binding protein